MNTFYAVDRTHQLAEGMTISLTKYDDVQPNELQEHVDILFPDGFSVHGKRYLLENSSHGNISEPAIELLFEYVRQAHFPEITSRFQSFFACETLEDARTFKIGFGDSESRIYEINTENSYFRGNMNLLDNSRTSLVCSYFAHDFWKGNAGPIPHVFWELMLELPVTVGNRIE